MQFSLYIHWPFCLKKCPYCDFNSYVFQYNSKEWVDLIIQEIHLYQKIFSNHQLKTIFFGGGTPSLIEPYLIQKILNEVKQQWLFPNNTEISIEVNPSSIETHKLEEFLKAGINRFSIGVQSFNDDDLKFLGRLHSADEAKEIVHQASKLCDNVSADFIYTLPHDTLSKWKKDLNKILEFVHTNNLKHLSLYQLTIEQNTKFAQDILSHKWIPMNQDMQSYLYRHTHKTLNQINWKAYEISNHSISKEYECQHNLAYWNYQQYLGIGPGAHSRMIFNNTKYRFNNYKAPIKWKEALQKQQNKFEEFLFLEECHSLNEKDQFIEKLLMGLRLQEGVTITKNEYKFMKFQNLELLIKRKFLKFQNNIISLTLNGRLKLNAILNFITQ